ncbi:MAG: FliH/SctL family protein [Eubacteriales bacterium]|nr:FliH/SctL family protein [Eubacteriales bacterium]
MTKSLSNLLKKGMTVSKSERVIDYNELIKRKLEHIMETEKQPVTADGFVSGLNADIVEQLISEDSQTAQEETSVTNEQSLEDVKAQADEIINNARLEAENIHSNAVDEADQIAKDAREQGYQEGVSQSQKEFEAEKARLDAEYEQKIKSLEEEYENRKAQLEPELVDVLTDVFKKVTLTVAEDNQEIIMHLINGVMRNADNSRDFIIKVSPDDYKFLIANQGKIYCAMSREIQLNIIEDVTMTRNQCVIETDTGIFNCSLDIELENLIKDLKLLSCT